MFFSLKNCVVQKIIPNLKKFEYCALDKCAARYKNCKNFYVLCQHSKEILASW